MSFEPQTKTEPAPVGRNRLLVLLPLIIFGGLSVLFLFRLLSSDPTTIPSALIGKTAPDFNLSAVEGLVEDGVQIPGLATADLNGVVSVVNVWASWCVPCREENPMLLDLKKRGYRVVGINYKDSAENARRFLGQFGNPYAAVGTDRRGQAAINWGVYGVPETFIVDGKGTIVHKHIGPFTADDLAKTLIPAIEAARSDG